MARTKEYHIHPAVGVARMGNSTKGVQLAPEVPWGAALGEYYDGGISHLAETDVAQKAAQFRGSEGGIRRSAARFRIFEYSYEETFNLGDFDFSDYGYSKSKIEVKEVTTAEFEIEWELTLCNKKNNDLDPNSVSKTLTATGSAPTGTEIFKQGDRLMLGEALVEADGQLVLIGSRGNVQTFDAGNGNPKKLALDANGAPTNDNMSGSVSEESMWTPFVEDDAADGPVKATIKLKGGTEEFTAAAWSVVALPRFGGDIIPIVSLYDLALSHALDGVPPAAGSGLHDTSFTRHIYPIFKSLAQMAEVHGEQKKTGAGSAMRKHGRTGSFYYFANALMTTLSDNTLPQTTRQPYFDRLALPDTQLSSDTYPNYTQIPGGVPNAELPTPSTQDMPYLRALPLMRLQYKHMENWLQGNFLNDWTGHPGPGGGLGTVAVKDQPQLMDQAHMQHVCGGSFYPGIEVGRAAWDPNLWTAITGLTDHPLVRLSPGWTTGNMAAGDLTGSLAVPWQVDFVDCEDSFWPASRPGIASADGTNFYRWMEFPSGGGVKYLSRADFVRDWRKMGTMVWDNASHAAREVERTLGPGSPAP